MTDGSFTAEGLQRAMDQVAAFDLEDRPTFTSILWPFEGRGKASHEPVELPADFRRMLNGHDRR